MHLVCCFKSHGGYRIGDCYGYLKMDPISIIITAIKAQLLLSDSSKNITYNPLSELRSKLENCTSAWLLLLSLPRMVMLAHIQHLIGEPKDSDNKKPTIQPNDYMDCLLSDIKTSMHDRLRNLYEENIPDPIIEKIYGKINGFYDPDLLLLQLKASVLYSIWSR